MRILVKVSEPLASAIGGRKVSLDLLEGSTLADVLNTLASTYLGFKFQFYERDIGVPYAIFINEKMVKLEEARSILLHEDDRLFIFLPAAGGYE